MGEDEVDLIALTKTLLINKLIIVKLVLIFLVIGIMISFSLPKKYTASSTFIPQTGDPGRAAGGNLGGLASIAGINLGNAGTTSEISPLLYPKIVGSVNFKKSLLVAPITIEDGNKNVTYSNYFKFHHSPGFLSYLRKYTLGLPGILLKRVRKTENENAEDIVITNGLVKLSNDDLEHINRLNGQLKVQVNEKEGYVQLFFTMPEPLMAAEMAKFAEELLQKEVIEYKIQNAREHLRFTEKRFEEKRIELEEKQTALAKFQDSNQNISSSIARNQLHRLESEYNFAFNIYTEIAKQLEQAKLQVSKDTPVFSILDPVNIPSTKSSPNRGLIIFVFILLGLILGLFIIFSKSFIRSLKE